MRPEGTFVGRKIRHRFLDGFQRYALNVREMLSQRKWESVAGDVRISLHRCRRVIEEKPQTLENGSALLALQGPARFNRH
jgi:hypothetical protein